RPMPRFFFHVLHPRQRLTDGEGTLLANAAAARQLAHRVAHDLARPSLRQATEWQGCSLQVCDDQGAQLFAMNFADADVANELESSPIAVDSPPDGTVVDLGKIRARRRAATVSELCQRLDGEMRRLHVLADQARYEAGLLYYLREHGKKMMSRSRELVARSREQSAGGGTFIPSDATHSTSSRGVSKMMAIER